MYLCYMDESGTPDIPGTDYLILLILPTLRLFLPLKKHKNGIEPYGL